MTLSDRTAFAWASGFRVALFAGALAGAPAVAAQQPRSGADTLRLATLQDEAVRRDPRGRQLQLLSAQSALRLRGIAAERLPWLGVNAQGTYQSDVFTLPFQLPGGATVPLPPQDSYDAHVELRERLLDPTIAGRRNVERAQLAESQARVRSSVYALRQSVNDAFFSALQLQSQRAELETAVTNLDAQLRIAASRVREGAALPSDSATLTAEVLRRRQSLSELDANRDAMLTILGELTGRTMGDVSLLAFPDLAAAVAQARAAHEAPRGRPEYEQFARSRAVLAEQRASVAARDLPRVSAFGRAGYGRPGLNPLARVFDGYWVTGLQLEWSPWKWGAPDRDREVLALQQQVVESEEAAFAEGVQRAVARDLATIDRLARALGEDDTILALREQVLRETQLRFGEGVITSAEYVSRETDVLAARLARASHRVELAQARARYLITVGAEVR